MVKIPKGFWNGHRVLVTGATGMVGSWLVKELLKKNAQVSAFILDENPQSELIRSGDFKRISVVNGSLTDFEAVERAVGLFEPETVFHLGAQTIVGAAHRYPLHTFEANIRGTYHLLEACRIHHSSVRGIVVASSDKAYGENPRLPYRENMPLIGRHPYEVSKSCADLLAQSYYHSYGLPVAIARCGNIYGGGDQNWSRIIPGTIRSFLKKERPVLRSDGTFIRDYFYVKDAVSSYLHLGERLDKNSVRGECFNFSDENPMSVLDIVAAIQKLMNCREIKPRILNSAHGEIRDQYVSTAKAKKLLGWKPAYRLEKGLSETIDWYRNFFGGQP